LTPGIFSSKLQFARVVLTFVTNIPPTWSQPRIPYLQTREEFSGETDSRELQQIKYFVCLGVLWASLSYWLRSPQIRHVPES